jgi:hypothetical protein
MKTQDYSKSFMVRNISAEEAFKKIMNVVNWWTSSFIGSAEREGDEFKVTFGDTRVYFRVLEVVPNTKMLWQVTNCNLHWLNNKKEWKDTQVLWEVSEEKDGVKITMMHLGLVPAMGCFDNCREGWNEYIGTSLPQYIAAGKGAISEDAKA